MYIVIGGLMFFSLSSWILMKTGWALCEPNETRQNVPFTDIKKWDSHSWSDVSDWLLFCFSGHVLAFIGSFFWPLTLWCLMFFGIAMLTKKTKRVQTAWRVLTGKNEVA